MKNNYKEVDIKVEDLKVSDTIRINNSKELWLISNIYRNNALAIYERFGEIYYSIIALCPTDDGKYVFGDCLDDISPISNDKEANQKALEDGFNSYAEPPKIFIHIENEIYSLKRIVK